MKQMIFLIIFFLHEGFSSTLIYCLESSPDYFDPQLSISGVAFDASKPLGG